MVFFLLPENIKKQLFWWLQGVKKENIGMEWINAIALHKK